MILFDGVSFQYRKSETSFVLKEVSFTLKKGCINGIAGNNGCGKSTLARLATGLLCPTSGKIEIDGFIPSEFKANKSKPVLLSGLIFQNPENQIVGTTVAEDLAFGLENLCIPHSEMQKRIEEISNEFGIHELLDKPISELSGGQKQLICIAGVMIMQPSWIFFDEPTSHLDPWTRKEFWNKLHSIAKKGEIGIAVISQLPGDLYEFEHLIVLENGNINFDDEIKNYVFPDFKALI